MKKLLLNHWAVIAIFAVWFVFAGPYFFKGLVPFPSSYLVTFFPPWNASYAGPVKNAAMPDVMTQLYPWKKITIEAWKRGEIPLWNPYSFSGTVQAANYQSAFFSPLNLIFFILPFIDAWSLLILLQPLLAALFMYLYLSTYVDKPGRLMGSLAFMLCGFMVVWMAYGTLGYAALFLPLVLWAIDRFFQTREWKYGALTSTGLAVSFLSGHFQISVYVLLFSFGYLVYKTLSAKNMKAGVVLGGFIFAGLLLALPQIWLTYTQFTQTIRSVSFGKGEVIPWSYLVTLIFPDFYGNPVTRNDWFGHYAEWASYIGVIPFLFAIYSLFLKKKGVALFYWIAAATTLLFAFPSPLVDLLYALKVPVLATSAASRIIILTSFSLAVLSAFGLDAYLENLKSRKIIVFLSVTFTIIFVAILGALFVFHLLTPDKIVIAKRNIILPAIFILLGLALMLVGSLKHKTLRSASLVLLLGITAFDLLRFATKWMPFDPREYVYPDSKLSKFLTERIGNNRIYGNIGGEFYNYYNLRFIEGYDTMYQERYGKLVSAASRGSVGGLERSTVRLDKTGEFSEALVKLLGVRYYLHRISDGQNIWEYPFWKYPYFHSVYRDENYEIFENTQSLPRAYLADNHEVIELDEDILSAVYAPTFNPKNTVLLEQNPQFPDLKVLAAAERLQSESVDFLKDTDNEIILMTSADIAKMLVLSDVYDRGWKAWIDGNPTPVLRANFAFRAVTVPAGEHTIRFFYQPKGATIGIPAAVITAIVLVGGTLFKKKL